VVTFVLAATDEIPGAQGKLSIDRGSGRAWLLAADLTAPPEGKAYQLWFLTGGPPLPGAVFEPDERGEAMVEASVPAEARDAAAFAVTIEPAVGATTPGADVVLKGAASS
jgi:anti-sigma-K factor RskA